MAQLRIGDTAPDFTLKDKDGNEVTLSDYFGHKAVVLYFYPKDETSGCTAQACSFRDSYQDFTDAGAEVIGVSNDNEASHQSFADNHRLPFVLLADTRGRVRRLFGVNNVLGFLHGRVTFVIGKDGRIIHKFDSLLNATAHVREALKALRAA